jgi:hypothetical protein
MPDDKAEKIALFRYGLIAPLVLETLPRGELTRRAQEIASRLYDIPHSSGHHLERGESGVTEADGDDGPAGNRKDETPAAHKGLDRCGVYLMKGRLGGNPRRGRRGLLHDRNHQHAPVGYYDPLLLAAEILAAIGHCPPKAHVPGFRACAQERQEGR